MNAIMIEIPLSRYDELVKKEALWEEHRRLTVKNTYAGDAEKARFLIEDEPAADEDEEF